jgi:hypothetical protein
MASEKSDLENQARESNDSIKHLCEETSVLTDDWDAPNNKENPRNWSACKSRAMNFAIFE